MFVVPGYKVPAEEEQNNFVGWHKVFVEETKISQFWAETFKTCLCSMRRRANKPRRSGPLANTNETSRILDPPNVTE